MVAVDSNAYQHRASIAFETPLTPFADLAHRQPLHIGESDVRRFHGRAIDGRATIEMSVTIWWFDECVMCQDASPSLGFRLDDAILIRVCALSTSRVTRGRVRRGGM